MNYQLLKPVHTITELRPTHTQFISHTWQPAYTPSQSSDQLTHSSSATRQSVITYVVMSGKMFFTFFPKPTSYAVLPFCLIFNISFIFGEIHQIHGLSHCWDRSLWHEFLGGRTEHANQQGTEATICVKTETENPELVPSSPCIKYASTEQCLCNCSQIPACHLCIISAKSICQMQATPVPLGPQLSGFRLFIKDCLTNWYKFCIDW